MGIISIKSGTLNLHSGVVQLSIEVPTLLSTLQGSDAYVYESSTESPTYTGGVYPLKDNVVLGQTGQWFGETSGGLYYESVGGSGNTSNNSMYKKIDMNLTSVNSVSVGYNRISFTGANAIIFMIVMSSASYYTEGPYMTPGWPYLPTWDAEESEQALVEMYQDMMNLVISRDFENNASGTLTINTSSLSGDHVFLVGVGTDYYNVTPDYQTFEIQIAFTSVVTT